MGVVQLSDELEHMIDRQVAEGRAVSSTAFLEQAVLRLVDDMHAEDADIRHAVESGLADIEAGRYTTIATAQDRRLLRKRLGKKLHDRMVLSRAAGKLVRDTDDP